MAHNNQVEQKRRIADLRKAMMEKDYKKALELCPEVPDGPFQRIGIYDDTVLHIAAHSKQKSLVLDLLKMVPESHYSQLYKVKNTDGNTILHELATNSTMKDAATELLERNSKLLDEPNELGEKPIFCAARYGRIVMFKFLAEKMDLENLTREESKRHLQRNDGTTVLHVSIASERFEFALYIVEKYPYLVGQRDQSSMTALQYLACNPTAFQGGEMQIRRGLMELLNISKAEGSGGIPQLFGQICEIFPEDRQNNDKYILRNLVKLLVMKDTSWDASTNSQPKSLINDGNKHTEIEECSSSGLPRKREGQTSQESLSNKEKSNESALFLATMSDIPEIVEEILNYQPQELKYTNKDGMNVLHVAILYRHVHIFDMVTKHEMLSRRLLSATDDEGNSILHMVSEKRRSQASEKMQSPALQLRDELLLFEKVKSASQVVVTKRRNNSNKTAEDLFAAANEKLHHDAKEWLMRTTENCTILSVFIATVAFAAIYTVPGGPNQNTGIPIFHTKPSFMVFTLADVLALCLALTSVGIFLSILTSSFPLQDFQIYLFKKLIQGIICLILSVSMMAVAFGATIVLMMSHNRGHAVWSMIGFLPVPIFFLSYSPLRSAVLGPCGEWFKIFIMYSLAGLFLVCIALPLLLVKIMSVFFNGLGWIVGHACVFIICKPLCFICRNPTPHFDDDFFV